MTVTSTTPPRLGTFAEAVYRTYEHSGFTLAGAVAFSFVISLFPFCIFLGALASVVGGEAIATQAVEQLFQVLPKDVAKALAPEVSSIMGTTRIDLLTISGFVTLFFATSAIETLRAALNGAYRVKEDRPYVVCLALSMLLVVVSAISMLVVTWAVVVGPGIAAKFEPAFVPQLIKTYLDSSWLTLGARYGLAALVIGVQLTAFHIWLAAGRRSIADVWPGVLLSVALWLVSAALYSRYLDFSDYTRFYAGLSQLMVAMIYFQVTAVIIILGAELNRGILELRRLREERREGAVEMA
ncbi:MAG: YihY/virulence factor BrkB family protein [Rhodospirillales bacterium]|nr:YihY/virulence factor BrkB family protein [Rhodospirillales bacterium]